MLAPVQVQAGALLGGLRLQRETRSLNIPLNDQDSCALCSPHFRYLCLRRWLDFKVPRIQHLNNSSGLTNNYDLEGCSGRRKTGIVFPINGNKSIAESGYRLMIPRMFAGLLLLSVTGIAIFFLLSWLTHLALRSWHESAVTRET